MSMFSISDELMPDGTTLDEMMKQTGVLMPAEFAGAVNLMAHPFAGVAVMSAIGLGFASHAAGVWLGALSGATVASQRMFSAFEDHADDVEEFRDTTRTPQTRAGTAAKALIAEAGAAPAVAEPALASPSKPASIEKPDAPDDLKAISGVGPKLEQVLNGLGVWTYAQVAAWGRDEIAWVDDTLGFKGRIERDGWIEQAAKLAAAKG
ncbi:NADH-ubiquinone dehydrogenase [Mesorhizobium sp. LHD-90]|uniref:NADH-ubiquinone dehydrogenase n=1 Tax=Mesorhizobium sp. LHD-90 TaxID=3071414 RepID=UPI0027E1CEEF|nr:NADH-ubiquinone dehydrogenase [Mesorhizobium sp. LHD-90]MDQ6434445.1 NADH-ubiquinone dehydrogenase [Mesorhizobium sp. LHD-90]